MGHLCDYCGDQRSMVYCRSDSACLCLSCDRNVHSANALSRRHSRTLLCERCNSQPASVRCVEEKISLCQNCDWSGHGSKSNDGSEHKRQAINCYSGCPSAAELSRIWSFVLDFTSMSSSSCERGMGLMSIDENNASNSWGPPEDSAMIDPNNNSGMCNMENMDKNDARKGQPSIPAPDAIPSENMSANKQFNSQTKGPALCENDLYEDFNLDDVDLNFDNYDELFGVSQSNSEHLFQNGGFESLFGVKNMSNADSVCQAEFVTENLLQKPAGKRFKDVQPANSNAASADSIMSAKTEPILYYSTKQAHSGVSLSFSGVSGECSGADYQDCGVSPMLLMGEPPWYPPGSENVFTSANRDSAVLRYKEKKKARKFEKKIRYASRKARADVRRRVKGRFVKAGEAYDYDPSCPTKSF